MVLIHIHGVISPHVMILPVIEFKRNLSFYSNYPVKWPHTTAPPPVTFNGGTSLHKSIL